MLNQFVQMIFVNLARAARPLNEDVIKSSFARFTSAFPDLSEEEVLSAIHKYLNNPKSIDDAIRTARTKLPQISSVTDEQIERALDQVMADPDYAGLDRNQLKREIESIYSVRVEDYRIIEREERRLPWLNVKKAEINWNFWTRYRSYLQDEKNFAPDTLNKLDRLTDRILDSLFDPTANIEIDKKGLVVGQVQSGKTSNYTGLICKAADAGYKLIIVLAGIHNNLRSQTQLRLDEGFLGFDTQHTRAFNRNNIWIGVGRINRDIVGHSLTSSLDNGDFTQGAANALGLNFNTNEPIIAVIKKNPHILRRLFQWLSAQAAQEENGERKIRNKSLLLIDDEADNASINISNDPERRSTINNWITRIISLFGKSGYVGYTATPFANIFIPLEEDNLFPRDFIVNIPPPSNYIGPERVFGFQMVEDDETSDTVLPIVNRIEDYFSFVPNRHKKEDDLPSSIPESLKRAIRCFILTCAIRRLRGQTNVHNSMLVHVSRFQRWQDHITELVQNHFDFYRMGIDQNDTDILEEFRLTFEEDSVGYKSYKTVSSQILNTPLRDIDPNIQVHNWEDILPHLNEAASRIEVRAIHGGSREALDYYDHRNGLSVIAIGGNKLSRGLTLEGLSVSYYLRASRMYDTLMQMGRWFGYRPGYVDLCRLFTSRELNEWFCHITHASEELREEFDYMSDVAGSTPEQYALKVRTFPGTLLVSSLTKLRQAVYFNLSYSGKLVQTTVLYPGQNEVEQNFKSLKNFVNQLGTPVISDGAILFDNVNPVLVLDHFISQFKFHPHLRTINVALLKKYITDSNRNNELTKWTVAIFSSQDSSAEKIQLIIGESSFEIGLTKRKAEGTTNPLKDNLYMINNSNITSKRHEAIDLEGIPDSYSRREIRDTRDPQNGLLMIYLLDPNYIEVDHNIPIVAFAFSFPNSPTNVTVQYATHNQLLEYLDWEETEEDSFYEED